jgi:hypothetical protein
MTRIVATYLVKITLRESAFGDVDATETVPPTIEELVDVLEQALETDGFDANVTAERTDV